MKVFKFNAKSDNLFKAILSLKSVKDCEAFFRDLCTLEELKEIVERWEIVRLLAAGQPYREIADRLGVSTTTVGRVATWLNNGRGGYKLALENLNHHQFHSEKRR